MKIINVRNRKPTDKQRMAIDLILSGKAKTLTDALRQAGYSKNSVKVPKQILFNRKGVQVYLAHLDDKSRKLFKKSIQDKVMDTYFEGLDATSLHGKDAVEHPDYTTRVNTADRFSKFFGWERGLKEDDGSKYNQFNFFNVDPEKQKQFHENLKKFIKKTGNG